ncbi:MAG: hypothetical protein ACRC7O_07620, partial [Fimbriiglobus sp.]
AGGGPAVGANGGVVQARTDRSAGLLGTMTGVPAASVFAFVAAVAPLPDPLTFQEADVLHRVVRGFYGVAEFGDVVSYELAKFAAQKKLTDVSFRIDWATLPQPRGAIVAGVAGANAFLIAPAGAQKFAAHVDNLILQLNSTEFATRQAATAKLNAAIQQAVVNNDIVRAFTAYAKLDTTRNNSDSPEARARASGILSQFQGSLFFVLYSQMKLQVVGGIVGGLGVAP